MPQLPLSPGSTLGILGGGQLGRMLSQAASRLGFDVVILDPAKPIVGLNDSKKLSEKRRSALAIEIREKALAWCIAEASVAEIDRLNILHATMLAMQRAVAGLAVVPARVQVDGNRCPRLDLPCEAVVKGDSLVAEISAASILAKTARDALLVELDRRYPQYGLAGHKGYPTAAHLAALKAHGACEIYRTSFGPVRDIIANPPLWTDEDIR